MNSAIFIVLWQGLLRDRLALFMAFVLPVLFFTAMVEIQKGITGDAIIDNLTIGIVDLERSESSARFAAAFDENPGIRTKLYENLDSVPTDTGTWLKQQRLAAILVLPAGFFESGTDNIRMTIHEDRSNPVYRGIVSSMLDHMIEQLVIASLLSGFESPASMSEALDAVLAQLEIKHVDAFEKTALSSDAQTIVYSVAGLGILFLLFAMAGAGASLIDEAEQGTLARSLALGVSTDAIIFTRFCFFTLLGFTQVCLMFLWGQLLYDLELFQTEKLTAFLTVTLITAASAASLGLLFAVYSRSRMQLHAMSTVVILLMSALGGSLFPRYLMSVGLQEAGWFTFNTWSLESYQKVFWYGGGLSDVAPELAVLLIMGVVFFGLALAGARRWR